MARCQSLAVARYGYVLTQRHTAQNRNDGIIQIPEQVIQEYSIASEGKIYLFTGSKSTGGFCVTRKGLLEPSKLGHILYDNPELRDYTASRGAFVKYKGRSYAWLEISSDGKIVLADEMISFLKLDAGMKLLSIRSSDIAFTIRKILHMSE